LAAWCGDSWFADTVGGEGLVLVVGGDVQERVGAEPQEEVEVEVEISRAAPGPLEVEHGRDGRAVPQHVLEGDVAVNEVRGGEGVEGRRRGPHHLGGALGHLPIHRRHRQECVDGFEQGSRGRVLLVAQKLGGGVDRRQIRGARHRVQAAHQSGGQAWAQIGLATQPLVGLAVHPDREVVGQPHLVGDAAGPVEGHRVSEPGVGQGAAGSGFVEVAHRGDRAGRDEMGSGDESMIIFMSAVTGRLLIGRMAQLSGSVNSRCPRA